MINGKIGDQDLSQIVRHKKANPFGWLYHKNYSVGQWIDMMIGVLKDWLSTITKWGVMSFFVQ